MRDRDVREALHALLRATHDVDEQETLYVDELGLCGQVRVDVAVINGCLSGFELKSERDTLARLPKQVEFYSRVLDQATLVVASGHLDKAVAMLPGWWGVMEAAPDGEKVVLSCAREPGTNPRLDPYSLAQLLWRDEALEELVDRGLDWGVRSRPRTEIWQRLAAEVEIDDLRTIVRDRLRRRQGWRPEALRV